MSDFFVTLEKEFACGGKESGALCRALDSLLLGSGGSLFLGLLLEGRLGKSSSEETKVGAADIANWLDLSGAGQMRDQSSSDRSINLELFHDDGAGNAKNLGQLGADLIKTLLIEEDIVVELVLNLGLGPGLLLCLGTLGFVSLSALRGARTLIFYRLLCFSL